MKQPQTAALVVALVVAIPAGVGAASAPARSAQTRTVRIHDIGFHSSRLVIQRGDSVRWKFVDPEVSHNVTSRGHTRFRSSPTRLTGSHRVRFTRRGTYRYVCTIHPNMRGSVVVR
jgi:plastocyanin